MIDHEPIHIYTYKMRERVLLALILFSLLGFQFQAEGAKTTLLTDPRPIEVKGELKKENLILPPKHREPPIIFDIPLAYNEDVKGWIKYFQTKGRSSFRKWLERSNKYMPKIQAILRDEGLPQDLAYMAMIESGFSSHAVSTASAVGPWQFIQETGERYNLKVKWWIDERKDFDKSTRAAAKYLKFLYKTFKAWHLVAAGYNTGENRIVNLVARHQTKNFWTLANKGVLVDETKNYVPKLIAAALIAKAPNLYGFRDIVLEEPLSYDRFYAPGGTDLKELADALNVTHQHMTELNPELLRGIIPQTVSGHLIRIPKGSITKVSQFIKNNYSSANN